MKNYIVRSDEDKITQNESFYGSTLNKITSEEIRPQINILIVDDHPENLLALEAVLKSSNYHLVRANSGKEALKCILKQDFAVILLDVQMPGLNGFETAKMIKSRDRSKHIPIIFITAISQANDHVLQGYSIGAIDYIFKPFHPETLKLKVDEFVRIYENYEFEKHQYEKRRKLELKKINEELIRTKEMARLDRLNLVGEMAAGIAHEIRNPMTTVRGFLELSKKKGEQLSEQHINLMLEELKRANSIITEFLNLAKNKASYKIIQLLNPVIEALYPLIQAEATLSNKTVILQLGNCPAIDFDEKEIRQLVLNLALNGLEAMSPGGILTLKSYTEDQSVVLEVKDQGSGIKSEFIDKVGIPFFTTKESGTGLGLAICYSIAERHNATLNFNTSNQGTVFFIRFQRNGSRR